MKEKEREREGVNKINDERRKKKKLNTIKRKKR